MVQSTINTSHDQYIIQFEQWDWYIGAQIMLRDTLYPVGWYPF